MSVNPEDYVPLTQEEIDTANRGLAIQRLYASNLSQEEIDLIINGIQSGEATP